MINPHVYTCVQLTLNTLSDDEIIGVAQVTVLGRPYRLYPWYEKIKGLFTERTERGDQMHHDTKVAFEAILNERFSRIEAEASRGRQ